MITNMTEGKPGKILWRFALPLLCSVAFQQMYQIADSMIAGQCVGGAALAAIGVSYPVTMLFLAVATGLNLGCSVAVSQLFGAKEYDRMKTAVSTSILTSLVIAIALTVGGLLFCNDILSALKTEAYIFDDAAEYLRIYLYGMVFLFLYNICTGIFNALGDSRTPLYLLIGSSVGNVILDYVLVTFFDLGVAGVAWATFVAQGAASVLALVTLLGRLRRFTSGTFRWFSGSMLARVAYLAVPSILQQSFISVGNLFIQWLVNGYSWEVVGGFSAAMKLNNFVIVGLTAMGSAISSFSAQNIGAARYDRVSQGLKAGMKLSVAVAAPFSLLFALGGSMMMRLFVGAEEAGVIAAGALFLQVVAPFYVLISFKLSADGVLRGAGAMVPFMISTFSDLILRVVLAFVFSRSFGVSGIWWSWPVGWFIGTAASLLFVRSGVWKRRTRLTE
nr:MATE family efflux transporter [uncultured Butyricicoccus sp.]